MSKRTQLLLLSAAAILVAGGWATYRLLGRGNDTDAAIGSGDRERNGQAVSVVTGEPSSSGMPPADIADPADAATSAAAGSTSRAPGEPLPLEKFFLVDGQLSLAAAQKSMTGDRYDKHLQMLETQMATEPDAMDLAKTYQTAIAEQLRKAGADIAAQRFACGTSMCMGSIRSQSEAWQERWWQDFIENGDTPHSISLRHAVDLGGGLYEFRFMFVSDPGVNSVVIPPTPVPSTPVPPKP